MSEKTLLLVDDTESNIDILVSFLGSSYDLRVAMDGETALDCLRKENPDAVLLDVIMPGMNGFEVMTKMKDDEKTQHIPVFFISGMSQQEEVDRGMALGAAGFIRKPISYREVIGALKQQGL